jgi:hypothetical protein
MRLSLASGWTATVTWLTAAVKSRAFGEQDAGLGERYLT